MKKLLCSTCYESHSCESTLCKKCGTPLPTIPQDPLIIRIFVVCMGIILLLTGLARVLLPDVTIRIYQILGYGVFKRWLFFIRLPEHSDFAIHMYSGIIMLIGGLVLLKRHLNQLYLKYGITILKRSSYK